MTKLMVALDVPTAEKARAMIELTERYADGFKIGMELVSTGQGAKVMDYIGYTRQMMLDLKLHDIPRTVGAAVREVSRNWDDLLITVHSATGRDGIEAAVQEARNCKILVVTKLTTDDDAVIEEVLDVCENIKYLGVDGVVCPVWAAEMVRHQFPEFLVVCPGVRLRGETIEQYADHYTPEEARDNYVDWAVVGRSIMTDVRRAPIFKRRLQQW